LIYLPCDKKIITQHKVLFSVPKKNIKHAVDRNRIKRKIREAYRLNKHLLIDSPIPFLLGYVYVASDLSPTFEAIQKQVVKGLEKIIQNYEKQ
jgi:ribonuclease P protein component